MSVCEDGLCLSHVAGLPPTKTGHQDDVNLYEPVWMTLCRPALKVQLHGAILLSACVVLGIHSCECGAQRLRRHRLSVCGEPSGLIGGWSGEGAQE